MARQNQIVGYLKAEGLKVEVVDGAFQRGSSVFDPEGVVDHWTAGPKGSKGRPSLRVVTFGHSTLPGPLCNVYLDRRGVAVVVATGRANHAGYGSFGGYSGNSRFFGIEAEAANNSDWTDEQREAYPKVNAALLKAVKRTTTKTLCGHSEYALPRGRKIDINGYTMAKMRSQTQAILNGKKPVIKPTTPVKPKPVKPAKKDAYAKRKYTTAEKQRIMKYLQKEGFYKGVIDDDYGEWLFNAVKAFQSAQTYFPNMKIDGDWGPLMDQHVEWVTLLEKTLRQWRAVTVPLDPDGNYLVDTKRAVRQVQAGNFNPKAKNVKDRGAYYAAGGRVVDADPGRITCKMLGIRKHPAL